MTEVEWSDLLPHLRKIAQRLFAGIGLSSDWEDAVQHACLVICETPDVRYPRKFGEVVITRLRNAIVESQEHIRRDRQKQLEEIPVRAGFDDSLLAADWMAKARRRIPAIYREAATELDSMLRESHGPIKSRPRRQSQKMWRVRSLMRKALARVE